MRHGVFLRWLVDSTRFGQRYMSLLRSGSPAKLVYFTGRHDDKAKSQTSRAKLQDCAGENLRPPVACLGDFSLAKGLEVHCENSGWASAFVHFVWSRRRSTPKYSCAKHLEWVTWAIQAMPGSRLFSNQGEYPCGSSTRRLWSASILHVFSQMSMEVKSFHCPKVHDVLAIHAERLSRGLRFGQGLRWTEHLKERNQG